MPNTLTPKENEMLHKWTGKDHCICFNDGKKTFVKTGIGDNGSIFLKVLMNNKNYNFHSEEIYNLYTSMKKFYQKSFWINKDTFFLNDKSGFKLKFEEGRFHIDTRFFHAALNKDETFILYLFMKNYFDIKGMFLVVYKTRKENEHLILRGYSDCEPKYHWSSNGDEVYFYGRLFSCLDDARFEISNFFKSGVYINDLCGGEQEYIKGQDEVSLYELERPMSVFKKTRKYVEEVSYIDLEN